MVVDVAGFSFLMNRDEEGTHARFSGLYRDLLEFALDVHGGRLINKTGDGLLAEFASVVEAVRCAMDIQQGAAERNVGVPPTRTFRSALELT